MAETLFSLEVHVESVEGLRVLCNLPALCFRLLDFPTLIVHHVSPLDAEKLRQKLHMEDNEGLLHGLKDRHGNFQFQKGKSCLFKASIDTLLVQLQSVPLYVMLMDLWPRKPTLVGSMVIPLKKAIDNISADVYEKGVAVPSFYRDGGEFELYNLMGSQIAKAKLGYRLLSLGGTLIPHIPPETFGKSQSHKVETSKKVEQAVKGALEKVLPEIEPNHAREHETKDSRIEKEQIAITEELKPAGKQSVETQTHQHAHKVRAYEITDHQKTEDDVLITNTFCPPPLYFNYLSKSKLPNASSNTRKRQQGQGIGDPNHRMTEQPDHLDGTEDVDFVYYDPGIVQPDGSVGLASVAVQTQGGFPKNSSVPEISKDGGELLDGLCNMLGLTSEGQVPVLNALLQELLYITGTKKTSTEAKQASRGSKPLVTPRRPGDDSTGSKTFKVPAAHKPISSGQVVTHDKQKSVLANKKQLSSVIGLPRQRVRFKKTNLTYGMTRTQRMRFEMNQKDNVPERRRPCEAAASVEKENMKKESLKVPLSGDLARTYRVGSAKREMATVAKERSHVQVQTQELPMELTEDKQMKLEEVVELPSDSSAMVEPSIKPNIERLVSPEGSSRSLKSQNSLEVFIPQMEEGELEDKSELDEDWTTDHVPVTFYGHTGMTSVEPEEGQRASAMTMYSEDFEDSQDESRAASFHSTHSKSSNERLKNSKHKSTNSSTSSQSGTNSHASFHSTHTRSSNKRHENTKHKSTNSSIRSQSSSLTNSVASEKPIKSFHSPVKAVSGKPRSKIEKSEEVEQKITVHEHDPDFSVQGMSPHLRRSFSAESEDQIKEGESEGNYSDDFHSAGSEPENSQSDDSIIRAGQDVLDLPPPTNNLGYTY